jgi:hypothetical protein
VITSLPSKFEMEAMLILGNSPQPCCIIPSLYFSFREEEKKVY